MYVHNALEYMHAIVCVCVCVCKNLFCLCFACSFPYVSGFCVLFYFSHDHFSGQKLPCQTDMSVYQGDSRPFKKYNQGCDMIRFAFLGSLWQQCEGWSRAMLLESGKTFSLYLIVQVRNKAILWSWRECCSRYFYETELIVVKRIKLWGGWSFAGRVC